MECYGRMRLFLFLTQKLWTIYQLKITFRKICNTIHSSLKTTLSMVYWSDHPLPFEVTFPPNILRIKALRLSSIVIYFLHNIFPSRIIKLASLNVNTAKTWQDYKLVSNFSIALFQGSHHFEPLQNSELTQPWISWMKTCCDNLPVRLILLGNTVLMLNCQN